MATTKGSTGYGSSAPLKTTVSIKGASKVEGSYQNKSRFSFSDKQSGRYGSVTNKENSSVGDFQWKNGTTGTKNEYKQSSTVRFGDESGYTEVHNEQKVRNVAYDNNSRDSNSCITYNNEDGAPYGYLLGGNGKDSDNDGLHGGFGYEHGPYGGFDMEDNGPYGGFDMEDNGPYGGFDMEDNGPYDGFDVEDDGPYGGFGHEDGPYGGFDIEDDGPYGGFDYGIDDDGMYGGYDGYDSDY